MLGDVKIAFFLFGNLGMELDNVSSHIPFPGAATGWRPDLPLPGGKTGCFGEGVPDVVGVVSIASSGSWDTGGAFPSCLLEGAAFFGVPLSVGGGTVRIEGVAMDSATEPTCDVSVGIAGLATKVETFWAPGGASRGAEGSARSAKLYWQPVDTRRRSAPRRAASA